VKDLTLFVGGFYEPNTGVDGTSGEPPYSLDDTKTSIDLWAQYVVGPTTYAAEYSYRRDDYKNGLNDVGSTFFLAEVQQAIDAKWAVTGRVAWVGKDYKTTGAKKPSATTLTIAPTLTLTANLSFVFEYSYTKYKDADYENGLKSGNFVAAQVRFKF